MLGSGLLPSTIGFQSVASSRPFWFGPGKDVNSVENNKIVFGDIAVVSYASFSLVVSECVLSLDPAQCGKSTALGTLFFS